MSLLRFLPIAYLGFPERQANLELVLELICIQPHIWTIRTSTVLYNVSVLDF